MPKEWAYFDTSALVKRYISEAGSVRARLLLGRYRFLSSVIAPVELTSALCRRKASGDLAAADFTRIQSRLKHDRLAWELVEVTSAVLDQAEQLIKQTDLRTLDALHVATALVFQSVSGIHVPFITGDRRQREAAAHLELEVLWVGA
jgi:predicted nucleic acid-binding protein